MKDCDCGFPCQDDAEKCSRCGYKFTRTQTKAVLGLIIFFALITAVYSLDRVVNSSGFDSSGNRSAASSVSTPPPAVPAPTPPKTSPTNAHVAFKAMTKEQHAAEAERILELPNLSRDDVWRANKHAMASGDKSLQDRTVQRVMAFAWSVVLADSNTQEKEIPNRPIP